MDVVSRCSSVVAIDGPAGSGKSTVARLVAHRLGAVFLDTGAIYRCLALMSQRAGIHWADEGLLADLARGLPIRFVRDGSRQRVLLEHEDVTEAIRTPEMSTGASQVSRHPAVRGALMDLQRGFATGRTVVAEGRDTGTAVFPQAPLKVFLIASPEVRARRRHAELTTAGQKVLFERVLADQTRRDEADSTREAAPLRPAADAVTLDTSELDVDQVVQHIVDLATERLGD